MPRSAGAATLAPSGSTVRSHFGSCRPTAARICGFKSKDNKVLSLVQYQRGWMQHERWSDEIMCRALLAALLDGDRKRDSHFAGCLGAHWNELSRVDVNLMLFETPEPGRLARLLY